MQLEALEFSRQTLSWVFVKWYFFQSHEWISHKCRLLKTWGETLTFRIHLQQEEEEGGVWLVEVLAAPQVDRCEFKRLSFSRSAFFFSYGVWWKRDRVSVHLPTRHVWSPSEGDSSSSYRAKEREQEGTRIVCLSKHNSAWETELRDKRS